MDENGTFGPIPDLDDSFVGGAEHVEPSYRERLLDAERQRARERSRHYRQEMENGIPLRRRHRRTRTGTRQRTPARPASHRRQIIGLAIAAVVIGAYYYTSRASPLAHGPTSAFAGTPVTACPASIYPAGSQYRFEDCQGHRPLGWSRCSALTVSINPIGAPTNWQTDTSEAIQELDQATGLKLDISQAPKADITITWATILMGSDIGAGRAGVTDISYRWSNVSVAKLNSAVIQLSTSLRSGTGANGEVPVLLHELGHAVGLGHFEGAEVMNPVDQGYASYQPGDLEGLTGLYQPQTCK